MEVFDPTDREQSEKDFRKTHERWVAASQQVQAVHQRLQERRQGLMELGLAGQIEACSQILRDVDAMEDEARQARIAERRAWDGLVGAYVIWKTFILNLPDADEDYLSQDRLDDETYRDDGPDEEEEHELDATDVDELDLDDPDGGGER